MFLIFIVIALPFITATNGEVPTDIWLFKLHKDANPTTIAHRLGMEFVRTVGGGKYYAFRQREQNRHDLAYVQHVTQLAEQDPHVRWFEKQSARQQSKRSQQQLPSRAMEHYLGERYNPEVSKLIEQRMNDQHEAMGKRGSSNNFEPPDPYYYLQWHLKSEVPTGIDAKATWDRHVSYRGNGYVIGVVDDGLDYMHPDISPNYSPQSSYDFNNNQLSPMPDTYDKHGTAASGVAAAASNNYCGVGACPECKLSGIKLIAGPSSDYTEAAALGHGSLGIYSNSWGPTDDGKTMMGPGPATRATIANAATLGRGGLGTIYVWAGGNGAQNSDNVNYDGYANSRHVIAVGAVNYDGTKSYYSENGAALTVSAPSSGTQGRGITTTYFNDNMGPSCTSSFGGTSSAAPLVAGAIGAMLGKYPNLSKRDVVAILAKTSTRLEPQDRDWTPPGINGVRHSHKYGFGVINMYEMTREAVLWQPLPTEVTCSSGMRTLNNYLLSDGGSDYTLNIQMPYGKCNGGSTINTVETVELKIWLQHPRRGDLRIYLEGPSNIVSEMQLPHGDYNAYPSSGWTYSSKRHFGHPMSGIWSVVFSDKVRNGITGHLTALELIVYGH